MKKQKPIRKEQSLEELADYFSDWKFDDVRECINKIMREHPEVRDSFVIGAAAEEMINSAYTGVILSTDDALRLVEYMEPKPIETILRELDEAGVTDDNIFDVIFSARISDEDYSGCMRSLHARKTANQLQRCADALVENPDIILLMLPEYSPFSNQTFLALAFLGDELSQQEQRILEQMKKYADGVHMKTEYEVTRIYFDINNIWE